jgi:N-acetylmuramoyl-L-alanine amidase
MSQTITPDITLAYTRIVERYAHLFVRPEIRLRYLNHTLTKHISCCEKLKASLERYKFFERSGFYKQIVDWWLYVLIIKEVKKFSRTEAKGSGKRLRINNVPFGARVLFLVYQLRYAFGVLTILAGLVITTGLCSIVLDSTQRSASSSVVRSDDNHSSNRNGATGLVPVKYLPDYKPVKVWLVEERDDVERFSNGLRILKIYETTNHQRGYNLFQPDGTKLDQNLHHDPVGIVYHTSESELIPFNSANNASIENHSNGLLSYVRTHKSYNYLIDRFGQVYRIVRDDQAANHAGNSTWADQKALYVGLNESFLGICFETKSEANQNDEQLTEAQLLAGRLLTQVLRSRYNIDDANCVTHGLVSVNPKQMAIAYHHDWVRNFPFEAMGLSDKYKVPTTSISVYGFTYDDSVVALAGGEIWSGAKLAEEEFQNRAAREQAAVSELRNKMRDLYSAELAEQNAARRTSGAEDEGAKGDGMKNESSQPFDNELAGNDG